MGDTYINNIKILAEHNLSFIDVSSVLERIDDIKKYVVEINGNPEFKHEDKYYRLTSEEQENEAKIMTRMLDFEKDNLIIVFGIGNIKCLQLLLTKINEGSRVAIFEPNLYVLKYVLQKHDLVEVFKSDQFVLFPGDIDTMEQSIKMVFGNYWSNLVQNVQVISSPNYYIYEDYMLKGIKSIVNILDLTIKALGNCLLDIFEGFRNNYKNVDAFLTSNSIEEIEGKYEGYPAFVIASGPSLDKNIRTLCKAQDKALIIACDASYKACKENGIKVDAIASIERGVETYRYFYEGKEFDDNLVLVGPGLIWPKIFEEHTGKTIIMSKLVDGQEKWWTGQFSNVEFVNQGFSCAHVAFATALKAGCNPIVLVGQDLAYTDEKIHSESTHTKYEGKNKAEEKSSIWVEDVHGDKVRTNEIYNLFRSWYEYQISFCNNIEVIDATEGGALIKGSIVMTLEETINKYCSKKIEKHMHEFLKDINITKCKRIEKYQDIIRDSEKQITKLEKIQKKAASHHKTLQKLKSGNFENMKENDLIDIVIKMQKGDRIVKYIVEEEKSVTDYYQQIIKQTIIYVKQMGNQLTKENVKRNLSLQSNLMYMIKDSTPLIITEYRELQNFLQNKLLELSGEKEGVVYGK